MDETVEVTTVQLEKTNSDKLIIGFANVIVGVAVNALVTKGYFVAKAAVLARRSATN